VQNKTFGLNGGFFLPLVSGFESSSSSAIAIAALESI
jgi:hypothetical protein